MEKMTIHRGLAELKLLDKRIESGINSFLPVGYHQKDKPVNGAIAVDKFIENAKSEYQSITDLIKRKTDIKMAIVQSNAKTMVKIGDKEMTVADAINQKMTIDLKKKLIQTLRERYTVMRNQAETQNVKVEANALKLAEQVLGKQNVKLQEDDVKKAVEPYLEMYSWKIVDPLGIEEVIKGLIEDVAKFETEVDATLSESNAVTFIEV